MKPAGGRRVRDNMGKTNYHVACMLQRENRTPCKSLIMLGTDLYRLRHRPADLPRNYLGTSRCSLGPGV